MGLLHWALLAGCKVQASRFPQTRHSLDSLLAAATYHNTTLSVFNLLKAVLRATISRPVSSESLKPTLLPMMEKPQLLLTNILSDCMGVQPCLGGGSHVASPHLDSEYGLPMVRFQASMQYALGPRVLNRLL